VDRFATVESIDCDGVFCWISRVLATDFERNLAHNIENLDWLAETSVAHQRVIAAIGRETEILPVRLGTIFRTEASLCKHVGKRAQALKDDFARIKGADEWGVKVFEIKPVASALPRVRSGKDYLKAKAALLPNRRPKSAGRAQLVKFERALEGIAAETAPAGNVSRAQRGLEFQMSLLVKRSKRKKLESLLEKFAREWVEERRIECTGPWPPYSFVSRADDALRPK
jgi:Gas vesicle synthesis protein GvpL/GvpF